MPRRTSQREAVIDPSDEVLLSHIDALAFTRLWTGKEALLKEAGVGLTRLTHCRLTCPPSKKLAEKLAPAGEPPAGPLQMTLEGDSKPAFQIGGRHMDSPYKRALRKMGCTGSSRLLRRLS